MANGALGPVSSTDNGDGTFTFQMPDGTSLRAGGQVAQQKHAQLSDALSQGMGWSDPYSDITRVSNQSGGDPLVPGKGEGPEDDRLRKSAAFWGQTNGLDPSLVAAAGKGPDMRTANGAMDPAVLAGFNQQEGARMSAPAGVHDAAGPVLSDASPSKVRQSFSLDKGGGPKKGDAPIAMSQLVGAGVGGGPQGGQIPTVVTGGVPAGARVVPGHMQLGATQTQQTNVPEAAKQAYAQASDNALQANEKETSAEAQAAGQIAGLKRQNVGDLSSYDQRMAASEAARQQYLQARQGRLDDLSTKFQAMKDEHAPSAGLGGAIALGLGAAGAVLGHSQNFTMDIVNKQIDAAVDAQKGKVAKARNSYELEGNAYAQAYHLMGDQRSAELAVRAKYIDQAVAQLDSVVADVKSPLAQARGQQLKAQLLQQKADTIAKIGSITEHNSYVMSRPQVVGGGPSVPIHDDVKKNEVVKGDGGKLYEFGEGATAQKAAEQIAGLNQQESDAHELARLVGNPANLVSPEARSRAAAISARMVEHAKGTEGNGVKLSKEGIELLEKARGGDPNALTNFGKSAGLNEYIQGVKSQREGLIQQHAVSQVREFRDVDAKTGAATLRYVRQQKGPERGPDLSGSEVGE